MLNILRKYEVLIKGVGWFFTAMIIPMSIWFISLHVQVNQTQAQVASLAKKEKETQEKLSTLRTRVDDKLDVIIEKLGLVQGELKRIKNDGK